MYRPKVACIVLLPGVDEQHVLQLIVAIRQTGVKVTLIGLSHRPVTGCYGVAIAPDLTVDQVLPISASMLLILPDSSSTTAYMTEPRLHRLITGSLHHGGYVATMPETTRALRRAGLESTVTTPHWLSQHTGNKKHFLEAIIALLL